jgi:hypothetical protein
VVAVATFILRVWLPDRPGALGAVASRIGAVKGDVVGIEILERGGDRVIDELVVELPSEDLVPLLLQEIGNVDGIDCEDIRPAADGVKDHRLDALETAALLVAETTPQGLLLALARHARRDFDADWVAVVSGGDRREPVVVAVGDAPEAAWLTAFVAGTRTARLAIAVDSGPDDIAWAPMPRSDVTLVLGRRGRAFRARERQQTAALSLVADARLVEVGARKGISHPAVG